MQFGYFSGLQAWTPILIPLLFFILGNRRASARAGGHAPRQNVASRVRSRAERRPPARDTGVVLSRETLALIVPGETTYEEVLHSAAPRRRARAAPVAGSADARVPGSAAWCLWRRRLGWLATVGHWDVSTMRSRSRWAGPRERRSGACASRGSPTRKALMRAGEVLFSPRSLVAILAVFNLREIRWKITPHVEITLRLTGYRWRAAPPVQSGAVIESSLTAAAFDNAPSLVTNSGATRSTDRHHHQQGGGRCRSGSILGHRLRRDPPLGHQPGGQHLADQRRHHQVADTIGVGRSPHGLAFDGAHLGGEHGGQQALRSTP